MDRDIEQAADLAVEVVTRVQRLIASIDEITVQAGGVLRCKTCGTTDPVLSRYWQEGWPKCCGHTMRWWTQKQIDNEEMP